MTDATWPSVSTGKQISAFVQVWTANRVSLGPDWDSRSWWVERPVSPEVTFTAPVTETYDTILGPGYRIDLTAAPTMSNGDTMTITSSSLWTEDA